MEQANHLVMNTQKSSLVASVRRRVRRSPRLRPNYLLPTLRRPITNGWTVALWKMRFTLSTRTSRPPAVAATWSKRDPP